MVSTSVVYMKTEQSSKKIKKTKAAELQPADMAEKKVLHHSDLD
jgi:hypothetical protein